MSQGDRRRNTSKDQVHAHEWEEGQQMQQSEEQLGQDDLSTY
jgi:hypothetical protein